MKLMSRKRRYILMTVEAVSLIVGLLLGWRFKALALVPTAAIALIFVIAQGSARGDSSWWIVVVAAATISGLQIGYFVGLWLRHILAAARSSRSTPARLVRPTLR
jgi:hypothetical protein